MSNLEIPEVEAHVPAAPETPVERSVEADTEQTRQRQDAEVEQRAADTQATEAIEAEIEGGDPVAASETPAAGTEAQAEAGGLSETISNISKRISDALSSISTETLRTLITIAGFFGLDAVKNYLSPIVEVRDIHAAMKLAFPHATIEAKPEDKGSLQRLHAQHMSKRTSSNLTDETYPFATFYQEKIDELKREAPRNSYSISDLVQTATEEETTNRNVAAGEAALRAAGATPIEGTKEWTVSAALGEEITTVNFVHSIDKGWQWKTNKDTEWHGRMLDLTTVTEESEIEARTKINALATQLNIREQDAAAPQGGPINPETPEGKKRIMVALIDAFNTAAGEEIVQVDPGESWEELSSAFRSALANEVFDTAEMQLELDGGDLEATDTGWFLHLNDNDIIVGWEEMIRVNPADAVRQFMKLDPAEKHLDSTSTKNIRAIKKALRASLPTIIA